MFLIPAVMIILIGGCSDYQPVVPEPEIQPTVQLSLSTETVGVGEQGILSLEMKDIDDRVFGLSLQIVYDPLLVTIDEANGFTPGDFLGADTIALFQVEAGVIHLAIVDISTNEKTMTNGSLGTITIQGLSAGQCGFTIDMNELRFIDAQGENLEFLDLDVLDVSFTVLD